MKQQIIIGEYCFDVEMYDEKNPNVCNNELSITVTNRSLCECYCISIGQKTDSHIFETHRIINEPKILYEMIIDALNKKNPQVEIQYGVSENQIACSQKIFTIKLSINFIYMKDTFEINLPMVNNGVTQNQVRECVDFKVGEMMVSVNERLNIMMNEIDACKKQICHLNDIIETVSEHGIGNMKANRKSKKDVELEVDKVLAATSSRQ